MIHTAHRATPRQQKREATFDRIVQAAVRALAKGGLEALTMQHLAAELGFAVGALYRYFPSKDSLVVAVQCRTLEELGARIAQAVERGKAQPGLSGRRAALLRLWLAVRAYEGLAKEKPTEFGLLSLAVGDPRPLIRDDDASQLVAAMAALFQKVDALFARASEAGALSPGDPAPRTLALWTSVQGALQLRKMERFSLGALDAAAVTDEAALALLIGWGAPAEDAKAAQARSKKLTPP